MESQRAVSFRKGGQGWESGHSGDGCEYGLSKNGVKKGFKVVGELAGGYSRRISPYL